MLKLAIMHLRNNVKPGLPFVQQVIAHGLSIIFIFCVLAAIAAAQVIAAPADQSSQTPTSTGQNPPPAQQNGSALLRKRRITSRNLRERRTSRIRKWNQGGAAQQPADQGTAPEREDNGQYVFTTTVQEVQLHATVVDDKHRFVTDLDKGDFTVFEDGKPQTINSFRREDVPVSLGIIIDNSGSMRDKRPAVNQAAINLVKASNPQDQVFIVNFNDEYYLDQDFTANITKLRDGLEKIESRGGTALYDAVMASADHLKKNSKLDKKVLLVVTDGEDNASRSSLERAVRFLQAENGPVVYTIGLLGDEHAKRARRALQTMAEDTGGVSFFPKDLKEVDAISSEVAHDIRNQYTIGYKPTTPQSAGGYRTVKVEAKAPHHGKLVVRTRSGYYPGQEQAMK